MNPFTSKEGPYSISSSEKGQPSTPSTTVKSLSTDTPLNPPTGSHDFNSKTISLHTRNTYNLAEPEVAQISPVTFSDSYPASANSVTALRPLSSLMLSLPFTLFSDNSSSLKTTTTGRTKHTPQSSRSLG